MVRISAWVAFAALRRRLASPPEVSAQRKRNRKLKPAADSVDAPGRALQRGGVRVRDLHGERVWRVRNGELESGTPGDFLTGPAIEQRRDVARERDPAMQSQCRTPAHG